MHGLRQPGQARPNFSWPGPSPGRPIGLHEFMQAIRALRAIQAMQAMQANRANRAIRAIRAIRAKMRGIREVKGLYLYSDI